MNNFNSVEQSYLVHSRHLEDVSIEFVSVLRWISADFKFYKFFLTQSNGTSHQLEITVTHWARHYHTNSWKLSTFSTLDLENPKVHHILRDVCSFAGLREIAQVRTKMKPPNMIFYVCTEISDFSNPQSESINCQNLIV